MKKTTSEDKPKLFLLSWIVIPLLAVWLSTNYIVGSLRRPSWEKSILEKNQINSPVFSDSDLTTKSERIPLNWDEEGLVTIWFDDAWLSQFDPAYRILETRGYKGTLAVATELVGYPSYMSWDHIKVLENKGWEIASHSKSHSCDLTNFTEKQLETELVDPKKILESKGFSVSIYVAPCGTITDNSHKIIERSYRGLRTVNVGLEDLPVANKYSIKAYMVENYTTLEDVDNLLLEAKKNKKWLNLVFHQIDYSQGEYSASPEFLKQIVNAINNSGLKVVLPSQVLELEK